MARRRYAATRAQGQIAPVRAARATAPGLPGDLAIAFRLQRSAGNRAVSEALGVQRVVGLAKQSRITRATGARVQWRATATPLARASDYAGPALAALRDARIPVPAVVGGTPGTGYAAEFRPGNWEIVVNLARFENAPADAAAARKLVGDFYHEARHADQYYLAARYIAAKPRGTWTADERYVRGRVLADVWMRAWARPLPTAGLLTSAANRRNFADAPGRAARYIADFARAAAIQDGMAGPARLVEAIEQAHQALPERFPDEAARAQEFAAAAAFAARRQDTVNRFENAWHDYVNSTVETEAYGLGAQVGGTNAPGAQQIQALVTGEDGNIRGALTRLEMRIRYKLLVRPQLPATPPPPLPPEPADDDQPPPLPATMPPPVPEDEEPPPPMPSTPPPYHLLTTTPVQKDEERDPSVQRHPLPEEIEKAIDE